MFLTFFYILLGSTDNVSENTMKAMGTNKKIVEGFDKMAGKIISFACLMMFIQ